VRITPLPTPGLLQLARQKSGVDKKIINRCVDRAAGAKEKYHLNKLGNLFVESP
jgi:hypothetical protein